MKRGFLNPVVFYILCNVVGIFLNDRFGIAHGNADTRMLEHFEIIFSIAKRDGFFGSNSVELQKFFDARLLAAAFSKQIDRLIAPARNREFRKKSMELFFFFFGNIANRRIYRISRPESTGGSGVETALLAALT